MKKLKSQINVNRRDFLTESLGLSAFIGLGCPGLLSMDYLDSHHDPLQSSHKFQTATNYSYEQLFNFTFRSWLISYMKRMQEEVGSERFLEMLTRVGDAHYRSRVASNFEKIEERSVQSLIENFWEPTQKSKFGNAIMSIEIPHKAKHTATVKMTECLFAKTFTESGAGDIGYAAICHADFAVAKAYNPKIKLVRKQCLMKGDARCLFEYTLES